MRLQPALLGLSLFTLASCGPKEATTAAAAPQKVTVAKPVVKKVVEWDEFVGRLESTKMVHLRARVSGYLEKIHFKEGTEVKEGDLLITIDPRPYQAAVEGARAELERNRTRSELAKNEAKRAETLIASRAIAAEDYDTRLKAAAEADASVKVAEAALRAAELELEFTSVRAPITGRISNAPVTEGNLVTGGERDSTLLTTIVALDPVYVYFEVDEQSALKYRELHRQGTRTSPMFEPIPVEMGLANESGFPRKGKVDFVDNVLRPDTGTIRARGIFDNPDKLMAPGFFARVRIPGSGQYDALLIRDEAIGSDQGRSFVFVINADNKAEYRPIETGPMQDGLRIVRSGLKPEERIVTNGVVHVRNGNSVAPEESEMALATPIPPATAAK
ncbi:efflux RND transporter periplasmic adaptor subunit [Phragmitibacter flavus]|uniref:Efflux RND transporter periplasmic adaptor subunit n=1 Tax=Phragmitibacter flavus TaxID=2576071 RepID=A0A5R8KFQ2_9BACT|nr:efflux RND transporter periplasmic adaptor subunit [Phragmitibacter flavus]TLD71106.1 efflux RND transporter periplasmic adaptor subunit [Phragmitibacter flavus]